MPDPAWASRAPATPIIAVQSGSDAVARTTGRVEPPVLVRLAPGIGTVPVHHYGVTVTPDGGAPIVETVQAADARAAIDGIAIGTALSVSVVAVNAFGVESAAATASHVVAGRRDLPADPAALGYVAYADGIRHFVWDVAATASPGQIAMIEGFLLRAAPGADLGWSDLVPIAEAVLPVPPLDTPRPLWSGVTTIGVASIDRFGRLCVNPATLTVTLGTSAASRRGRLDFSNPGQSIWL